MTSVIDPPGLIRFEGFGVGTEIWGSTQANFAVVLPGRHTKETAILLNDPAGALLAETAGRDDTPEFREAAARAAGEALLHELVGNDAHIPSLISVSRALIEAEPGLRERIVSRLA